MQPKRITVQKTLGQRTDAGYKPTQGNLSSIQTPFREPRPFSQADFGANPTEEFPRDVPTMDYALPDFVDSRVFRLIGGKTANGNSSEAARSFYELCKRGLDISVAVSALLLGSPVILVITLLVKLTSRGPVFFAHKRLGLNGKEFYCLKFRTMVADAEDRLKQNPELRKQFEEKFKLEEDPRITPLGSFLRRTSLDELPQLLHVLRGEMSLIGPRPIVESELNKYSIYASKLLTVKPGLSGLWQVCGRSDTTYPQRVIIDMHYIDHRCLSLDLQLLLLTASAVVRKSGAW